ncbi:MAG: LamG-like jellyroll fold domain-containing protein, partial [Fibrobacterota bacterium]
MFLRILFVIFTICLYSYGAWGTGGSYPEYIVTDSIVPPDNSINQSLSVFLSAKDAAGNPYSILGTSMPLRGIATYGPDYFNSDPTVSAFYKFDEKIEYNSKDTSGFKLQYPLGTGNARTLKGVFGNGIALSDSSYAVHFFPPNLGCEIYDTIDIIDTVGGGGVFDTSVGYRWRQAAGSDSAVLVSSYKELNIYDIPQRFYYDRETDPTEKDTVMFWYEDTRKGNPDQIYRDSRTNLPYSAECWVFSREGENTANKFASIVSNQGVYSYGGYTFGLTEMKPFFGAYTWATLPLVEGAGANYVRVVSEKKIPDGRWVHLAYSIDASAAVTLYIDGLRVPTHMDTVGLNGGKIESSMENAGYYGTGNSFSLWGIAPNYDYLSKEFRLGKTGIENYTVFKGYIDELVIHKGKTNASGDYYTMNTYSGLNFSSDPLSFSGSSVNFQVSSPVNSQLMLNSVQAGDLAFSSGPVAWSAEASGDYAGLAVVMPGQTFNVAEGRVENSPAPVDVGEEFSAQVVAVDAHGNKVSSVVPIIESVYIVYDSAGTKDSVQAQYSVDTSYSGTTELKVTQQLAVSRSIESFQLHINAQYFSPISGSSDDYIALSGKFEGLMVVSNGQQYIPGQGPSGPTDTVVIPDSADISVYLVDEQTNNIEDLYTRDLSPTEYEVMPQLSVGDTLWADRSYYVVDQDLPASIAGKQWVRTFFNHKETPINFRFYPTLPVTVYIAFPRSGGLDSSMAVGNGTASIFGTDSGAGVLPYVTDLIGSVTFSAPSSAGGTLMEASDYNGDGTITGDGSGWIDYNTGAWGLEFAAPVQNGGDIKVKYSFNLTPGTITKYFDMHPDSAGKTWLPTADSILVSNWSGGTSARTIWSRTYTGADLNENPAVVLPTPKTGNGNMYVPFISLDADLENVVSLAVNDPDAVVSRVEPADGVIKSPIQYKVHHSSSYPAVVPTAVFDSTIYNNKDNSGAAYAVVKVIPSTSFEFNIIDGASEWVDNSSQVACTAGVMVKMEIRAVKDSSGVRSLISDFNATEMSVYSVYGNTPYTTIPQQFGTDSLNMQTLPSADSDPKTVNVNFQGGVDTVWVLLNNAEDDGQKIIFSDTIDGIGEIYNEMKTDVYPGEMALVSVSSSPEPHSDYGDDITITANSTTSFYAHSYDAYGNYIGTEDATYTFDA